MPEVFGILDDLIQKGKIRFYGVSVEKVEEALRHLSIPMFNLFKSSIISFARGRQNYFSLKHKSERRNTCPAPAFFRYADGKVIEAIVI